MLPHTVYGELSYNLALEKVWVCTSRLYVAPKFSIYYQYPDRCGLKEGSLKQKQQKKHPNAATRGGEVTMRHLHFSYMPIIQLSSSIVRLNQRRPQMGSCLFSAAVPGHLQCPCQTIYPPYMETTLCPNTFLWCIQATVISPKKTEKVLQSKPEESMPNSGYESKFMVHNETGLQKVPKNPNLLTCINIINTSISNRMITHMNLYSKTCAKHKAVPCTGGRYLLPETLKISVALSLSLSPDGQNFFFWVQNQLF